MKEQIKANRIEFLPAVNEDLAATAVLGSQQVETNPDRHVRGRLRALVRQGPRRRPLRRCAEARQRLRLVAAWRRAGGRRRRPWLRLLVDAAPVRRRLHELVHADAASGERRRVSRVRRIRLCAVPLLRHVGRLQGALGDRGIRRTRSSCIRRASSCAPDFTPPPGGLHYRWPDLPGPQIEERMEAKKHAVCAFAKANPIDRRIYDIPSATYGIVTTGKAHLDLMEALRLLGLDEAACRAHRHRHLQGRHGLAARRCTTRWNSCRASARSSWSRRSAASSRASSRNTSTTIPARSPSAWSASTTRRASASFPGRASCRRASSPAIVAKRLDAHLPRSRPRAARARRSRRTPSASSRCRARRARPTSAPAARTTPRPRCRKARKALAGIGCHFMASWMDRETTSLIQMGGEGVNWAASSHVHRPGPHLPEPRRRHLLPFRLHGDPAGDRGRRQHHLQDPVQRRGRDDRRPAGRRPDQRPCHRPQVGPRASSRIALVSDHPDKFEPADLPTGVTIHPREDLDAVQRELREIPGVTVLIYEQTCATEKRRRRKRGHAGRSASASPIINDLVCEGCGDCSVESNCLSVEPQETPFGRKRKINQSTCNKDFSCLERLLPELRHRGGRHAPGEDERRASMRMRARATLPVAQPARARQAVRPARHRRRRHRRRHGRRADQHGGASRRASGARCSTSRASRRSSGRC